MTREENLNKEIKEYFEDQRGIKLIEHKDLLDEDELCFIFTRVVLLKYVKNIHTTNENVAVFNINRLKYSNKPKDDINTYEDIYDNNKKVKHDLWVLEHIGEMLLSYEYNKIIMTYNERCLHKAVSPLNYINGNSHLYYYDDKSKTWELERDVDVFDEMMIRGEP